MVKLPSLLRARPIQQMPSPRHARNWMQALTLTAFALACAASSVFAQSALPGPARPLRPERFSTLPPTPPTAPPAVSNVPAANTLPAPMAATPLTGEAPANRPTRAQVTFIGGQLDVRANDSSLNQILRAISRATGLKITGGVQDQRVFGNYGPASTASVLATLLDGTGTNILLLEGDATVPPELILTARGGGPAPPNPNAPGFDDGPDPAPAQNAQSNGLQQNLQQAPITQQSPTRNVPSGPQSIPQPDNNVNGSPLNTSPTASTLPTTDSVPIDSVPTPSTTPSTSGIVDAPNPPAPGSTTGTAPNGAVTPEQIYQQLLEKQKQQTNSAPFNPATPVPSTPQ